MTSRERVLTALRHEEPDRVPIDFGSTRVTGIMAVAYKKLKDYLGIKSGTVKLYDLMQQLAFPESEVVERLGGDVVQIIRLRPFANIKIDKWKTGKLSDGTLCEVPADFNPVKTEDGTYEIREDSIVIARKPPSAYYFELSHFPLKNVSTYQEIDDFLYPELTDEEQNFVTEQAKYWHKKTDYAVMGTFGTTFYEQGAQKVFGFQTFMENLVLKRDLMEYWLDKQMESTIKFLDKYFDAIGDYIHIIQFNEDLGSQNGLQISPTLFREIFKPRFARLFQFVKGKKKDVFIFLHSCGSIRDIIPDLIDVGVDVLNPVQTSAKGMNPVELKKEYGKYLSFWGGGIETQTVLPFGTIDEVKKQVIERLKIFAPGGGYIFNQIHNIQADVPPKNIVTMFETALKYGRYLKS